MRLTLTLILVASVVVLAQPPQRGPNRGTVPTPGGVPVVTSTYAWAPTATITTKELAALLPLFGGPYTPTGRLRTVRPPDLADPAPTGARTTAASPRACPANTALFTLTAEDTTRLGALMKHLKACTLP